MKSTRPMRLRAAAAQRVSHTLCAFCCLWLLSSAGMVCAEDLRIRDRSWNGLSELLNVARAEGAAQYAQQLDVAQLPADAALIVVHPTAPLPSNELAKFMRRGGRVAVADDFGAGQRFFATFGMGLHAPRPDQPNVLRHNEHLPIATPLVGHALADGVPALVTNHPQVLFHPSLTPVFGLSGEKGAVVLSGAVGSGRLVAISDASVFINNMLQLRGNRVFARNLIHFLRTPGRTGPLFLADSDTRWLASASTLQRPLSELTHALERLAQLQLPRLAVSLFSIALAGVLLSMLATALPKRSAYARRAYLQSAETVAGLAGRVSQYAEGDRSLLTPLLTLRRELAQRAGEVTQQPAEWQKSLHDGGSATLADELGRFVADVDRMQAQHALVSARHFSELVAVGRRILADLDAFTPPQRHERHE